MRSDEHRHGSLRVRASVMRKLNGALLLDLIRREGPLSRAELARRSGLTKPTVSSQVAELLRERVVVEQGSGQAGAEGGRRPTLVSFNAGWGWLVGVEIGSDVVRAALADLNGEVAERHQAPICPERGAGHILDVVVAGVSELLARRSRPARKLVAMAVAAPGRVDPGRGVVLEAGNVFNWHDIRVRERLERAFPVSVAVENDVNLAALGELEHGAGREARNFVLIRLGTGVGAGVVLGGRLYQGSHWAAGEIGHMILDHGAVAGRLSERGYFESVVGSDLVSQRARLGQKDLLEVFRRHEPAAEGILEDLAAYLAAATVNLAAAYDPDLIVMDGDLFDLVMDRLREVVARAIPWPVRLERSKLGTDAVLLGAIGAARQMAQEVMAGRGAKEFGR